MIKRLITILFISAPLFAGTHIMQGDTAGGDLSGTYPNPTVRISGFTSGSTNYIQNTNTLQVGATFYTSSGTVMNSFNLLTGSTMSVSGTLFASGSAGITGQVLASQGDGMPPVFIDPIVSQATATLLNATVYQSTASLLNARVFNVGTTTVTFNGIAQPVSQSGTWNENSTIVNVPTVTISGTVPVTATFTTSPSTTAVIGYISVPSTITANAQLKNVYGGRDGAMVTNLDCPRDMLLHSSTTITNSTTETVILSSGSTGIYNDVVMLYAVNSSTTPVRIDFRSSGGPTAQSIDFSLYLPGQDQRGFAGSHRWPQMSNASNWTAQVSASTNDVRIFGLYCKTQ